MCKPVCQQLCLQKISKKIIITNKIDSKRKLRQNQKNMPLPHLKGSVRVLKEKLNIILAPFYYYGLARKVANRYSEEVVAFVESYESTSTTIH